jgi:hypothetical protein
MRALPIVDDFTRESPAIEMGFSQGGERVAPALDQLRAGRGLSNTTRLGSTAAWPIERQRSLRERRTATSSKPMTDHARHRRTKRIAVPRRLTYLDVKSDVVLRRTVTALHIVRP